MILNEPTLYLLIREAIDAKTAGVTRYPGPFRVLEASRLDLEVLSPPPPGQQPGAAFSGFYAMTASVVRNNAAIGRRVLQASG